MRLYTLLSALVLVAVPPAHAATPRVGLGAGAGLYGGRAAVQFDVPPSWSIYPAGSPALSLGIEYHPGRTWVELAVESQPTLQFSWGGYDMMTIPLLVISSSWTFGSPSFRAGPMISGGLLTYGAGARALYQPFQRRNGKRHGLDLRLNWWGYVTGELTMLYTREL